MKVAAPSRQDEWRGYARAFRYTARLSGCSDEYIDVCLKYARPLLLSGFPVIYDGLHFCMLVGYETAYVFGASNEPTRYYRIFRIPKRSGDLREICEPLPSLKEIQAWILENILNNINVSEAAKGFVKKKSVRDNARFHRNQNIVVSLDIEDFFTSIKQNRVNAVFNALGYSQPVAKLLTELCCYNGYLPQGAPTSPALSNIVFRGIDQRFLGFAKKYKYRYSRYADDLTFSGDVHISSLIAYVGRVMRESGFWLNRDKTRVMRKGSRQLVTGVVVNSKLQVSREHRRLLRQRLYFIRKYGLESHVSKIREPRANYLEHVLGTANYILSINPDDRDAKAALIELNSLKKSLVSEA